MWDTIQSLDWEAIISAILASTTLTSLSIVGLIKILGKFKTYLTSSKKSASELIQAGKDLVTGQTSANETITNVKEITSELNTTVKEMQATYAEAKEIVEQNIEMINEFKKVINEYKEED